MTPRRVLATLIVGCVALAASSAHANVDRTARYVVPGTFGVLFTLPANPVPGIGVGGYTFPAEGKKPLRITVNDDFSGSPVAFSACQDSDGDLSCDDGEPYLRSCGDPMTLSADFVGSVATTVFVKVTEPALCEPLATQATQGTITLTLRT